MAFCHLNYFSPTLGYNTDVNVFIPTPTPDDPASAGQVKDFHPGIKFPAVYMLHGAYGDYTDWYRQTRIERYAQARQLALVMPSAGNSFYADMVHGQNYLTFISKELPLYMRTLFPISEKREETYIAGLSMGGYGAVRAALMEPETFSKAISLSGALDIVPLAGALGQDNGPFKGEDIFGDLSTIEGSDADLFALARKRRDEGRELPKIFHTIGTEDHLYGLLKDVPQHARDAGLDLTYSEHPGIHDWWFWDTALPEAFDWLSQQ